MCFGPSTLEAGAKARLESRLKKFTATFNLQAAPQRERRNTEKIVDQGSCKDGTSNLK